MRTVTSTLGKSRKLGRGLKKTVLYIGMSLFFACSYQQEDKNEQKKHNRDKNELKTINVSDSIRAEDLTIIIDSLTNAPLGEKSYQEFKRLSHIIHSMNEYFKTIDPASLQDTISINNILPYANVMKNRASYATMLNDPKQKAYGIDEYIKLLNFIKKIPLFDENTIQDPDTKKIQAALQKLVLQLQSNIAGALSDNKNHIILDSAGLYASLSLAGRKKFNRDYNKIHIPLSSTIPHLNLSNIFIHKAEILRKGGDTRGAIINVRKALDHLYQIRNEDNSMIVNNIVYCYVLLFQYGEGIDLLSVSKEYVLFSNEKITEILLAMRNKDNLSLNQIKDLEGYKQMLDTWIKLCEELDQQQDLTDNTDRGRETDKYLTYASQIEKIIQSYLQSANAKKEAYELQNEALAQVNKLSQEENRRLQIIAGIISLFLLLVGGFSYALRRSRLQKIRDNKTISEQNAQILKISDELANLNGELERRVDNRTRHLNDITIKLQEMLDIVSSLRRSMEHIVKSPIMRLEGLHMLLEFYEKGSSDYDEINVQIQDAHKESKAMIYALTKMFEIYRTDFNDIFLGKKNIDTYHKGQLIPEKLFGEIHGQALQSALHISYADGFPESLKLKLSQDVYYYLMECVLDNAYKFSSSKAICDPDHIQCINVLFALKKKRLIVTVQDNGVGIDADYLIDSHEKTRLKTISDVKKEEREKIEKESETQKEQKTLDMIGARGIEGQLEGIKGIKTTSGMGLTYIYQVVEKLQGSVIIRPNENGKGITVTLNLPIIA